MPDKPPTTIAQLYYILDKRLSLIEQAPVRLLISGAYPRTLGYCAVFINRRSYLVKNSSVYSDIILTQFR